MNGSQESQGGRRAGEPHPRLRWLAAGSILFAAVAGAAYGLTWWEFLLAPLAVFMVVAPVAELLTWSWFVVIRPGARAAAGRLRRSGRIGPS